MLCPRYSRPTEKRSSSTSGLRTSRSIQTVLSMNLRFPRMQRSISLRRMPSQKDNSTAKISSMKWQAVSTISKMSITRLIQTVRSSAIRMVVRSSINRNLSRRNPRKRWVHSRILEISIRENSLRNPSSTKNTRHFRTGSVAATITRRSALWLLWMSWMISLVTFSVSIMDMHQISVTQVSMCLMLSHQALSRSFQTIRELTPKRHMENWNMLLAIRIIRSSISRCRIRSSIRYEPFHISRRVKPSSMQLWRKPRRMSRKMLLLPIVISTSKVSSIT